MTKTMTYKPEIPAVWKEENPGYHRLSAYGQNTADGWHCWGCKWMNSDASITREEAAAEHGEGEDVQWW